MKKKAIYPGPIAQDFTVDLMVVGFGTGMATALAVNKKGLKSLVIEKSALVGGSTARSGGAFWIPTNLVLQRDGSDDTLQKAENISMLLLTATLPKLVAKFFKTR